MIIPEFLRQFIAYVLKMCAFLMLYISPIHGILLTVYLLLFADLLSGLGKAIKLREHICASKLRLTVMKFVYYSIAIFIAFQIDKTMIAPDSLLLTRLISGYITMVEFKSLIENISKITERSIWMDVKDKIIQLFDLKVMKKGD